MGLVLKEKIVLTTPQGLSEVQLLFGSITDLPLEEKVDLVFVSCFQADYSAVPSTLIGALKRNLGIEVGKLAQNKDINLLHNFNCWVSKPLPDDVPFRRLVCFERNRSQLIPQQISGIFRAMMPVFNNQDTTVITPLLAAGNQNSPKGEVLKAIVNGACHWIKAGLPLRCLKIVVYMPNTHSPSDSDVKLIPQFQQYKKHWEKTTVKKEAERKKYDVCMSYSGADTNLVSDICVDLSKMDKSIVIFKGAFKYNPESVWQEHIFNVMANSRRIIAVLTPNYTEDVKCLDQFNVALCCNRLSGSDVLVPFYLQTVPSFPSYMMLIQYTDCRVRKEGDKTEEKIFTACSLVVEGLDKDELQQQETQAEGDTIEEETSYDIFISYAHRTPKEAGQLFKALQEEDPSLKVFLDRNELRMGNVWQETLYEAVDRARMLVAFITSSYLQSPVCQEEYNIALARYLTEDGLFFIPILAEDIEEIPSTFAMTPIVDLRDPQKRDDDEIYGKLAATLISYLRTERPNQFSQPSQTVDLESVLDEWRRHLFRQRFKSGESKPIQLKADLQSIEQQKTSSRPSSKTVALSFTNDCLHQAATLTHLLRKQTEVKIMMELLGSQDPSGTQASKLLDSADMVVVFLSDKYLASAQHRTELHIALCRQRMVKDQPVVYLIEAHHSKRPPVYPYLLPHIISLRDRHWFSLAREQHMLKRKENFKVLFSGGMEIRVYCTGLEYLALQTAAIDVTDKLVNGSAVGDGGGIPTNIVNLAGIMRQGALEMEFVEKCLVPFSEMSETAGKDGKFVSRGQENMRLYEEARKNAKLVEELEEYMALEEKERKQKQSSACHVL